MEDGATGAGWCLVKECGGGEGVGIEFDYGEVFGVDFGDAGCVCLD